MLCGQLGSDVQCPCVVYLVLLVCRRIIEATFHHADDMHLYFNMVSFLWKARTLERRLGSGKFLYMLGLFTVLVNTVLLYLNYLIAVLFQDPSYLEQCAVGFSGAEFFFYDVFLRFQVVVASI